MHLGKGPTVEKPVVICHFPLSYPILPQFFIKVVCLFINLLWMCAFSMVVPLYPICPISPRSMSHFTPGCPKSPQRLKLRVSKIINYTKWHDVEVTRNAPLLHSSNIYSHCTVLWSWLGLSLDKIYKKLQGIFPAFGIAKMSHFSPVSPTPVKPPVLKKKMFNWRINIRQKFQRNSHANSTFIFGIFFQQWYTPP